MSTTPSGIAYVPLFPPGNCISTPLPFLKRTPSSLSYAAFSDATPIPVSAAQFSNAPTPMLPTPAGISTAATPAQWANA